MKFVLRHTALRHGLDTEVLTRCRRWLIFDCKLVGGRIELKLVIVEDGGDRHHQLDFGNARTQAGVVTKAEGSIGAALTMLVASSMKAINVELLRLTAEFWQAVRDGHANENFIAQLKAIARHVETLCNRGPVAGRDPI